MAQVVERGFFIEKNLKMLKSYFSEKPRKYA
nr:MAG TPA: hypothetical protein [Caudoviricetes sp.]